MTATCYRCGLPITADGRGSWVDATDGDGCGDQVHGPASDVLPTGEVQPRLPGAEGVRDQEIPTPTFEMPFSLTPEDGDDGLLQTPLFGGRK